MPDRYGDNFLFCDLTDRELLDQPISEEEKELIDEIIHTVANLTDTDEIAEYLYYKTTDLIPCDLLAIGFIEEQGNRIRITSVISNYPLSNIMVGAMIDSKNTVLEKVMKWKYPLIINDLNDFLEEHPRYLLARLLVNEDVRSSMTCPLVVMDRPLGFIFRSSRKPGAFNRRHIRLSSFIIPRIAQVLEKLYMIDQLRGAIDSYMELLSFITHELKSPLDSILTLGNTVKDGYLGDLNEKQGEYIQKMMKKAQYLRDLTDEYLTLSRFESERIELNLREIDYICEIIEETIEMLAPQMDEKNITLTRNFEDDLPAVSCDPNLIRIVFTNLLSNAIKYNEDGGEIRVNVRLYHNRIITTVWNTGPGFDSEEKNRLFRKFSRIENSELMKRRGSGIGLYTSWKIIQMHSGRIWADSSPGSWAEFGFLIPFDGKPYYNEYS
jgi:hypothetical protein